MGGLWHIGHVIRRTTLESRIKKVGKPLGFRMGEGGRGAERGRPRDWGGGGGR